MLFRKEDAAHKSKYFFCDLFFLLEERFFITKELLPGGYINEVYADGDCVIKEFKTSPYAQIPPHIRLQREATALQLYQSAGIVPQLLAVQPTSITQERIFGETLEEKAKRGEQIMAHAGYVLRFIHLPTNYAPQHTKDLFQQNAQSFLAASQPILQREGIHISFSVNWEEVFRFGITWIHGDFWLANILHDGEKSIVIDWEYARIGSPYEDFAALFLWGIRKYGQAEDAWNAYGQTPHSQTLREYIKLLCLDNLSCATLADYDREGSDGFYHEMVTVLKQLSKI